jgi:hypothetical protein
MTYPLRFLLIITACLFCSCTHQPDRITGIKIYDYHGDYSALTGKWKEMGINTSFVSATLAANDTFRKALKVRNIKVFIIFPVFQDPEILNKDSNLYAITGKGLKAGKDWVEFVCPSRESFRRKKVGELASLVSTLDPDGISLDFIRQFVYWEMIYPDADPEGIDRACYCDSCLAGFKGEEGVVIPDSCNTTARKAAWLDNNCRDKWNEYRCSRITGMVRLLAGKAKEIKPGILINFHAVPWREKDFDGANIRVAAQDLRKVAPYVDYISPMCYSQMLKRDCKWISSVTADMDSRAAGRILPSIQVYPYYIDKPFTGEDFRRCLEEALKPPSNGVIFFSWPLFQKDSSRMKIVSEVLTGRRQTTWSAR